MKGGESNVSALPAELPASHTGGGVGLEPTTSRLQVEVTLSYNALHGVVRMKSERYKRCATITPSPDGRGRWNRTTTTGSKSEVSVSCNTAQRCPRWNRTTNHPLNGRALYRLSYRTLASGQRRRQCFCLALPTELTGAFAPVLESNQCTLSRSNCRLQYRSKVLYFVYA